MQLTHLIYHENDTLKPYIPQEDFYAHYDNIFVIADGVRHDLVNGVYPDPPDSGEVAKLVCSTFVKELKDTKREVADIQRALPKVNEVVKGFNISSSLYKNKETNGYNIGATVFAVIIIKEGRLVYAVLDDCFFSIFSEDLVDHPMLKSYVSESAKYYDTHYDWSKPEDRKVWRKDFRNHSLNIKGQRLGYGAVDGSSGFEEYIQYGEERLNNGDLICLYTDGCIEIMKDLNLVKKIKEMGFSLEALKSVSDYTKEKGITKERSCYFIRYKAT